MNKTEILNRIGNLKSELSEIDKKLAEVDALKQRRHAIVGGFHGMGELSQAHFDLRNCEFPKIGKDWNEMFIVSVDHKWITTRSPHAEDDYTVRFRRSDGMKEGSRKWGQKINVDEAVQLWEKQKLANLNAEI